MSEGTLPKRKYDSTRRRAQAAHTRRQILEAARQLFEERGYAGATVDAIAARAGVALKTVYAVFKSKERILVELFNASTAAPGEEHTPVPERRIPRLLPQESSQRRQLRMFAGVVGANLERGGLVSEILRDAARTEPTIAKINQRLEKQRWQHMALLVRQVTGNGALRNGMDEEYATDLVYTLASPEVFMLLIRERGWSQEKYIDWLAASLIRLLLRS